MRAPCLVWKWRRAVLLATLGLSVACAHRGVEEDEGPGPVPSAERDDAGPDAEPDAEPEVQTPAAPTTRAREPGTIFRDELVRATAGGKPGYLMGQLGPEAYRPAGRFQGWVINRVFPDDPTLCGRECDLRPKDVILTVNGSPLERPEQLSQLVESIGEMTELRVRLVRDGKLLERTYAIVD